MSPPQPLRITQGMMAFRQWEMRLILLCRDPQQLRRLLLRIAGLRP